MAYRKRKRFSRSRVKRRVRSRRRTTRPLRIGYRM